MAKLTYTTSASGVYTEDTLLEMYAGTPDDDVAWLDGGAAADSYPGSLDGFAAKNTNTTDATRGVKLVAGRITTAVANAETMDLTHVVGGKTYKPKILAFILGDAGQDAKVTAAIGTGANDNRLTFTVAGTVDAPVTLWMLVA